MRLRLPPHRAAAYGNERQVGEALHSSGLDRSEVFLETKIWISDYGCDETLHSFEKCARKLGVEQVDLLILHQALPSAFDRTLEAYRAPETLLADGRSFRLGSATSWPSTSRPFWTKPRWCRRSTRSNVTLTSPRRAVQDFGSQSRHRHAGVVTDRRHHLYCDGNHTSTLDDAIIGGIATAHGKSPAQTMLRWGLQHKHSVIPKSTKPNRIAENIDVFDFEMSADEMTAI